MSVAPTTNQPGSTTVRRRHRARASGLLLATTLLAPIAAILAATPAGPAMAETLPAGGMPSLDHLASTIGDLKASLSAIREDLAAMHEATPADDLELVPRERFCAASAAAPEAIRSALASELDQLRTAAAAERAGWQHAEAAMTGELTGLRERLAAADAAVAKLRQDREALVGRITELDQLVQQARTSEVVDALVEVAPSALEPAEAPPQLPATGLMRVTHAALAAEAPPALRAAGSGSLARAASRLDLQAELALAQLRIAELTTALDSARLREEAMEAEVVSLRSLTEAQIRRFMGRE